MRPPVPATWTADTQFPPRGTSGVAWPTYGIDDPESAEYGAWCFEPCVSAEGEEGVAYYCDPDTDLLFLETAARR